MRSYVIDTNVLIVANEKHHQADANDVYKCQNCLFLALKKLISIDSMDLIFSEYFKHVSRSGQPGIGDYFVKSLWDNQFNENYCERVDITPDTTGDRGFLEFPDTESLKGFDDDDRKFAAVAISSKNEAVIYNATDSDWYIYKDAFKQVGIKIEFLCPNLIKENKKD